jgi:signal transduction histidine kinase/DNA-binding NarL/FixJ family response regulator
MVLLQFWENRVEAAWFLAALAWFLFAALSRLREVGEWSGRGWFPSLMAVYALVAGSHALAHLLDLTRPGSDGGAPFLGLQTAGRLLLIAAAVAAWRTRSERAVRAGAMGVLPILVGAELTEEIAPESTPWLLAASGGLALGRIWLVALSGGVPAFRRRAGWGGAGLLGLVAAGVTFAEWNGGRAQTRLREGYLRRIQTAALALDADAIRRLALTPADLGSEDFRRIGDQLTQLRRLNGDVTYVYLWTLRGANIVYVAEGRGKPDAPVAIPGETYRPITTGDRAFFDRTEPFLAGPFRDPWGTFVSANSLVTPLANSPHRCWLAFDIVGTEWKAADRNSRLLGLALTALLVAVFVGAWLYRTRRLESDASRRARIRAEVTASARNLFLAKVSHELRTPLQTILGYGERLEREPVTPEGRARLAALREEGRQMLRLVNDLLDLGAVEAGEFRLQSAPLHLPRLVRDTIESLRPQAAAKKLALTCRIDPDVPEWVAGDAQRLRQILLNLGGNALKFTRKGSVEVAVCKAGNAPAEDGIELAVRDTGPGIPPGQVPSLFQPFARLETTGETVGTGLGLALVSALCRSAGGTVTVESDGTSGACFRVRLPLPIATAPSALADADPAAVRLTARRILVVDDNRLVRELFAGYLGDLGAQCETVADGEEALARVTHQQYDAIVLDLALPGIDGTAVARRLRQEVAWGRNVRLVGVSAHAGANDRNRALAAGMDAFLAKPVELVELAAMLHLRSEAFRSVRASLHAEMESLFRAEAARQTETIAGAVAAAEWNVVRARAHYLKNSAAVVRDLRLYAACERLEEAAEAANPEAVRAAWADGTEIMRRWQFS